MQSRGREVAWDVVRRLFTIAIVVLSAIALLGIVLAPWIVDLYTVGYPDAQREAVHGLATFFLRWFMPQVVFYGIGAVAAGLLNAHRRFAAPMFAPIANNVIVIATFLIFAAMPGPANPHGARDRRAAARPRDRDDARRGRDDGGALALGARDGVPVPLARRRSATRRSCRIGRLATWVVVYVVANQLGYLVIVILAGGPTGGYSSYAAAFILFQLPHAIFAVSILTALLPAMSSRWAAEDLDGYKALLSQGIRATATILIPAALGYLVLAKPIVRLLLEHGETKAVSAELVSEVLFAFAIGLFAFSAFQFLLRASYAMQDTRTPALVNVAAVAVNVLVDLLFFFVLDLGVPGLALGHAVSYWFASTRAAAPDPPAHRPDRGTEDPRVARCGSSWPGSRRRRWPGSSPRGSSGGSGPRRSRRRRRRCSARWWRGSPCSSRPRPRSGSRRSAWCAGRSAARWR